MPTLTLTPASITPKTPAPTLTPKTPVVSDFEVALKSKAGTFDEAFGGSSVAGLTGNTAINSANSATRVDFYVTPSGVSIPNNMIKTHSQYSVLEIETKSGKAVRSKNVVDEWNKFLGDEQTNVDPFTCLISTDRIWSLDGSKSIRFGGHEMDSLSTKNAHYHQEIWQDGCVRNILQRIQK